MKPHVSSIREMNSHKLTWDDWIPVLEDELEKEMQHDVSATPRDRKTVEARRLYDCDKLETMGSSAYCVISSIIKGKLQSITCWRILTNAGMDSTVLKRVSMWSKIMNTPKTILVELSKLKDGKIVKRLWNKNKKTPITSQEIRKAGEKKKGDAKGETFTKAEQALERAFGSIAVLKNVELTAADRKRLEELRDEIEGLL